MKRGIYNNGILIRYEKYTLKDIFEMIILILLYIFFASWLIIPLFY